MLRNGVKVDWMSAMFEASSLCLHQVANDHNRPRSTHTLKHKSILKIRASQNYNSNLMYTASNKKQWLFCLALFLDFTPVLKKTKTHL